jgi:hypothetical protein
MNQPANLPQIPPEFETLLKDPRLDGMQDRPPGMPRDQRVLQPANPPVVGESPFLLLREWDEGSSGAVEWLNKPADIAVLQDSGRGRGFKLTETPRFVERKKKPARHVDAWSYYNWMIVSPAFADIARSFDAEAIETLPIEWEFSDGLRLDGYQFFDVRRLVHSYDYHRSAVRVEMKRGKKFVAGLAHPRAVKRDLDPTLRIFRDAFNREDIFMSRDLARALTQAGMHGIRFEDPVNIDAVVF